MFREVKAAKELPCIVLHSFTHKNEMASERGDVMVSSSVVSLRVNEERNIEQNLTHSELERPL